MGEWEDPYTDSMADAFEIYAKWVGLDGWKVTIRKKNVGMPWQSAKVEGYHELTPDELLQVLDASLGKWLAT